LPPEKQFKDGEAVEVSGNCRMVIVLKRDTAEGLHQLEVSFASPTGEIDRIGVLAPAFSKDVSKESGYNIVSPIRFVWRGQGVYWLQIKHNKSIIMRSPLKIHVGYEPEN
jgi:hypothetical protein